MTTFADLVNQKVGFDPWNQPDRSTYLSALKAIGAERKSLAFRASLQLPRAQDRLPDQEAIDAFRTNNEDTTKLIVYNNLYSIHHPHGEAMMGDISEHLDWFLYTTDGDRVHNPRNGRHCFDFRNDALLDYIIGRGRLYLQAGVNGFEFDSFDVRQRKVFENGFWHARFQDGKYFDPIEIVNPRTGSVYTNDQWRTDFRYAANRVKSALLAEFPHFLLFVNGLRPQAINEYSDLVNGFFAESWGNRKGDLPHWYFKDNLFDRDIAGLISVDALGKYTVLGIKHTMSPWFQTVNSAALFGCAAVLLGAHTPSHTKAFTRGVNRKWAGNAALNLNLFQPIAPGPHAGLTVLPSGIYRREFKHSLVFVNPTESTTDTIVLPRSMYSLKPDGAWSDQTFTQISLSPGQGAILVNSLDPPDEPRGCLPAALHKFGLFY
jgi:hypothetical protein